MNRLIPLATSFGWNRNAWRSAGPPPNSSLERTSARRSGRLICESGAAGRSRSALNVGRTDSSKYEYR
jgi:hypothetical protein